MDTRSANGSFEHLGIFHRVAQTHIGRTDGILQFGHALDGVGQIHLHAVGQTVGDGLAEPVHHVERNFLHAGHILDGVLGGHRAVGDDMRTIVVPILILHPFEHAPAAVVIEVGINIGQRDTVGIEETLKQQVVFQGVDLGDTQTISHHGTGSRTTPGTYHHAQLVAGGIDKVLHDEEVARETHGLHDMELEADAVFHFFREGVSIDAVGSVVGQFGQIVGLELDAVELVDAAQLLHFLLTFLLGQLVFTVLIAGELLEKLLGGNLAAPFFLGAETFGNGEERHDGGMLDVVGLHLVEYLNGIAERLGNIGEDFVHLLLRLKPFLLGIEHTGGVVEVLTRGETEQMVVSLSVLLVHEVGIVGADELDAIFLSQFDEHAIGFLLQGEGFAVGPDAGVFHLVALQLQIIIVAEDTFIPLDSLTGSGNIVADNLGRHLSGYTGRAYDEVFVITLQVFAVRSRTHVEAIDPRTRDEFDQILVAIVILGQHDEVPSALVALVGLTKFLLAVGHIHLTAENGFERLQPFLLAAAVYLIAIVEQLLHAEHVAVVGDGHAAHAVANSLVNQFLDTRLSVEDTIIGMYV